MDASEATAVALAWSSTNLRSSWIKVKQYINKAQITGNSSNAALGLTLTTRVVGVQRVWATKAKSVESLEAFESKCCTRLGPLRPARSRSSKFVVAIFGLLFLFTTLWHIFFLFGIYHFHIHIVMAKKGAKATRKFAASGQLKKQIQARHKHQQLKKNIERRKGGKAGRGASGYGKGRGEDGDEDDGDEDREAKGKSKKCVQFASPLSIYFMKFCGPGRKCLWTTFLEVVSWPRMMTRYVYYIGQCISSDENPDITSRKEVLIPTPRWTRPKMRKVKRMTMTTSRSPQSMHLTVACSSPILHSLR